MKQRPSYTKEFKLEAVRLLERGDKPAKARNLKQGMMQELLTGRIRPV
jgi:transposase-like protein